MDADLLFKKFIGSTGVFLIIYGFIAFWNMMKKRDLKISIDEMCANAKEGNIDIVMKNLEEIPSAIHNRNSHGETVLQCAVRGKHLDLVALLLHAGASAKATTLDGSNSIDIARAANWNDGLKLLEGETILAA